MAVSGGYIYKQVKGEGLQAPLARTQQPAEPTAMQVSEVYGLGSDTGVGVGFKV